MVSIIKSHAHILLMVIFCFSACKDSKVENVNLEKAIESHISALTQATSDSLKFDLCSFIPLKWDSLVVVGGYSTPENLKILGFENDHVLGQFIDMVPEHSTVLLYIKSNNIVGYSDLGSSSLRFDFISRNRNKGYTTMNNKECNFLMTRKYIWNGHMNFDFKTTLTN
jgi:hypothetical protein